MDSDGDTISGEIAEEKGPLSLEEIMALGNYLAFLELAGRNNWNIGEQEDQGIHYALVESESILKTSDFDSAIENQLSRFKDHILRNYDDLDESISESDGERLSENSRTWIGILKDELSRETRLPISNDGLIDTEKLMESPGEFFDREVWKWLDERPKNDIREACRTLAINCPTASTMLSLRAVEYCLVQWHEQKTGNEIELTWGQVLGVIEDQFEDDHPPVLSDLDYLLDHRNDVMHPNKSVNQRDAVDTIYRIRGTIAEIYEEMPKQEG